MKTGLESFKSNMSLSKREFFLVAILLIALEGYLLITYILQPTYDKYSAARMQLDSTKTMLETIKADFAKKSLMEQQIVEIKGKLENLENQIPPYYSQEEAIMLLDGIAGKNSMNLQMINFDNPGAVPSVPAATDSQNATQQGSAAAASAGQTAPAPNGQQGSSNQAGTTIPGLVKQDISINFTGSYEQIYYMLSDMEKNIRKVSVNTIAVQKNKDDLLAGQMNLSLISYWEQGGQKPYTMETQPGFGKNSIFAPYSGYSESMVKSAGTKQTAVTPDFYLVVNGYLDNAEKVKLTQYPDAASKVSADVNAPVIADITLNGNEKTFTYEYSIGSDKKSGSREITVRNGKILLEVIMQAKKDEKDKVAVTLNVTNNTKLPFEVNLKGTAGDRFAIGRTKGNVVVK